MKYEPIRATSKMILTELPDCKSHHTNLTKGKDYEIVRELGNCFVIQGDRAVTIDGEQQHQLYAILKVRFNEA